MIHFKWRMDWEKSAAFKAQQKSFTETHCLNSNLLGGQQFGQNPSWRWKKLPGCENYGTDIDLSELAYCSLSFCEEYFLKLSQTQWSDEEGENESFYYEMWMKRQTNGVDQLPGSLCPIQNPHHHLMSSTFTLWLIALIIFAQSSIMHVKFSRLVWHSFIKNSATSKSILCWSGKCISSEKPYVRRWLWTIFHSRWGGLTAAKKNNSSWCDSPALY